MAHRSYLLSVVSHSEEMNIAQDVFCGGVACLHTDRTHRQLRSFRTHGRVLLYRSAIPHPSVQECHCYSQAFLGAAHTHLQFRPHGPP